MSFLDQRQRLLWAWLVFADICKRARPDLDWIGWVVLGTLLVIVIDLWWDHRRRRPKVPYTRGWSP